MTREQQREIERRYEQRHRAERIARKKIWRKNNLEKSKQSCRNWRAKNKGYGAEWMAAKRKSSNAFRALCAQVTRIWMATRSDEALPCASSKELIGCSAEELKIYIESKFKPGMTWENYGRNGWHIDHVKACALFDLTDPDQQRACFHYTNLQPLWAAENRKKGKGNGVAA